MIDTKQIIKNNTIPESNLSKKLLDNIIANIESAKSHVASYTKLFDTLLWPLNQ